MSVKMEFQFELSKNIADIDQILMNIEASDDELFDLLYL